MGDETKHHPCYVGVTACGCWVAAIVLRGTPEWSIEVAEFVRDAKRRGLTIREVTTGEVRSNLARCTHKPARKSREKKVRAAQ